jgi:hypothetical protein
MGELASGNVGPEAKYVLKFEAGKMVVEALYDGAQFDAGVVLKLDAQEIANAIVNKLEEVIPGDQKMYAEALKGAIALAFK